MNDTARAASTRIESTAVVALVRAVGLLLMAWLLLAGILVAARTLSRSVRPLNLGQLVLAAVALVATAVIVRVAWRWAEAGWPVRRGILPLPLATAGVAIWTLALCSQSESPLGVMLFALIVAGEEAWAWRLAIRRGSAKIRPRARARGDRVVQQFTRVVSADGQETIEGSVAVSVDRGSRMGAAHVGFCPPFPQRPEFELRPATDKGAVFKVGQLLPQGARIEVKLPQPAEAARMVSVQFVARSSK